jgi:hypothetical protein
MPSGQQFLFAPDKPLVKRLGKKFFQRIPRRPGVYKMHDVQGKIVYVGKAKDLRQRLANYRIANPEQLPKRRLRLLREVVRIEFELCPSESAALKHETKLIRELKPKFNRAGVWQPAPRFLAWRYTTHAIEFAVQETPQPGWSRLGPLGSRAPRLRDSLVRLLWLVLNHPQGYADMPRGWANGAVPDLVRLECANRVEAFRQHLESGFSLRPEIFVLHLKNLLPDSLASFDRIAMAADLETLQDYAARQETRREPSAQMALL